MATIKTFVLIAVFTFQTVSASERRNVFSCEGSSLSLSCPAGTVINIIRANFGRFSNSVCPSYSRDTTWSTRCIQPTTLRVVNYLCGGKSSCSVPVSSSQFGDPCPDTPKYLELVYKCQNKFESTTKPDLPEWIMNLKALPPLVIKTLKPRTISTTTAKPSTTTKFSTTEKWNIQESEVFTTKISEKAYQSLSLISEVVNDEIRKEKKIFVNVAKEVKSFDDNVFYDNNILIAIVISAVSCFIIIFVGIIIFINKDKKVNSEMYVGGSESSSTYLQYSTNENENSTSDYNYVIGNDGRIYQTVGNTGVFPLYTETPKYHQNKVASFPRNTCENPDITCQRSQIYFKNI